jgi:hypothetical protein
MTWTDKLAFGLLLVTAIVAAIFALDPHVYRTTTETIGAGIGVFIVISTAFVLPVWLVLRIAVWLARALLA